MPKNSTDIFDLTDVSDLPEESRPNPTKSGADPKVRRAFVAVLQKADKPVSPQQVVAALFRTGYDGIMNNRAAAQQLNHLAKNGHIEKISHGQYAAKPEPAE